MTGIEIPKGILKVGATVAHALLGAGIVVGLVTHKIDPTIGVAILAGLGSFWSGVGVALQQFGTSTAATVTGGASVASEVTPAPAPSDVTHASVSPDLLRPPPV